MFVSHFTGKIFRRQIEMIASPIRSKRLDFDHRVERVWGENCFTFVLFLEKKSPMTDQQMNDPRNHFEKSMKHTYFPVPMENTWIRFFLTDTVHTLRSLIIFDKRTNLVQNSLPWAKKRETVCFFQSNTFVEKNRTNFGRGGVWKDGARKSSRTRCNRWLRGFDTDLDSHLWRGDRCLNGEGVVWVDSRRRRRRRRRRRKQSRRGLTRGRGQRRRRLSNLDPSRAEGRTKPHHGSRRNRVRARTPPNGYERIFKQQWTRIYETGKFRPIGSEMELVVGMKIASERTWPVASRRKNHGRDRKRRGGPRRCIVFAPGRRSLDAYERRALSDRSPSRHAAAHRSPSNFHKILFTLCSFYISSTFSFSLSLLPSLFPLFPTIAFSSPIMSDQIECG